MALTAVLAGVGAVAALAAAVAIRRRRSRAPSAMAPTASAATGRTLLGRYRLAEELGRGAMATVYRAHDLQVGASVAVKTFARPPPSADDGDAADARARFFREADAARRLQHPDIVRVFDAGEDDGVAFIAMEVLHGENLAAHTRAGSLLPVDTVLRTVARVALALDHAHRLGVVHRDIKPANVMLDPATGAVKVADFGIASVADAERTRTGVLLGTPRYMSPEQMAGGRVDGRSDLFSLGVVLYELLTGASPYREGSTAELLRQIAEAPAPDLRAHRPDLPAALADVVAQALQKRPSLRHADGRAFADALLDVARRTGTRREADRL